MPLRGGVVLDLTGLTGVLAAGPSSWRARAGTLLDGVDASEKDSGLSGLAATGFSARR